MESFGLVEARMGNYQAAGSWMERALQMSARNNPNYDYMAVNFAGLLMQTGHTDAALDLLNREIAESPRYARAWANRAVIHYQKGEAWLARTDAETALRLEPGNMQALSVLRMLGATSPGVFPR
jgi:tetratricopeptide (TPR) repeat protein